jgi:hypothetical protein
MGWIDDDEKDVRRAIGMDETGGRAAMDRI